MSHPSSQPRPVPARPPRRRPAPLAAELARIERIWLARLEHASADVPRRV